MLFKVTAHFSNIWALGDILVAVSWQTKSKKTPFLARPEPISNTVYNTLEQKATFLPRNGPKNRNIAGIQNLKSLPLAIFFQKINIDFTVYEHKIPRFQNCVMLFKVTTHFSNIWALGDILVAVSWQTKSKKTPFCARPEPISNTVYNTLEQMATILPGN